MKYSSPRGLEEKIEKNGSRIADELGLLKVEKIAMPFKIGCGMTKGHWPNYLKMIKEFARQYNKHVIIVVPDQSKFPNTYKTSGSDFTSQSSTNLPHGRR